MKKLSEFFIGLAGALTISLFVGYLASDRRSETVDHSRVGAELPAQVQRMYVQKPAEEMIIFSPSDTPRQGEALRVRIENPKVSERTLSFRDKEYGFFEYQGSLNAIVPLGVDEAVGDAELKIGEEIKTVKILPGDFQIESIPPPKPMTPEQLAQRVGERKSIGEVYASIAPVIFFDSPFIRPLEKIEETSPYGFQRIAEGTGQRLYIHNGVDLRAAIGTPVRAINDGTVEMAEYYLSEGRFIILDHGMGINSVYAHLDAIKVKAGDRVKKGDVIALSGNSGQSLGPHLHFTVKIDGIAVNPLEFLELWQ